MLVLIGASASGKTDTAKYMMAHHGIKKIITCTTRIPRAGETDGVDYHFFSIEEFEKKKAQGLFLETAFYAGNWYGTLKADVGDNKVACVDPIGCKSYRECLKDDMFCVYLDATEETRIKRMKDKRNDPIESVRNRIEKDRVIFTDEVKALADVIIDTNDMEVKDSAEAVFKAYSKWKEQRNH